MFKVVINWITKKPIRQIAAAWLLADLFSETFMRVWTWRTKKHV